LEIALEVLRQKDRSLGGSFGTAGKDLAALVRDQEYTASEVTKHLRRDLGQCKYDTIDAAGKATLKFVMIVMSEHPMLPYSDGSPPHQSFITGI
jgi:hypothetical protein